jgi:hypothetical protein
MAKKVSKWAIEENNGHMWVYFILSALQWLPTKQRRLKGQAKDILCRWCLSGEEDNLDHLTQCPANSPIRGKRVSNHDCVLGNTPGMEKSHHR